jgi:nucleolar pre-ribosomal-associated protein 1
LEIIFALYQKKLWDSEDLAQEVNSRLPDLQVFSSCLNNIPENKPLVKTAIFNVIALYSKTFPQIFFNSNFNLSSQVYEELLGGTTELSQFKLLQTRSSLTIQARLSKVGKWWNRTASASGSNHSIFVTLLRLGVFNDCLTDQIIDLLEGLTKPTPIFQLDTPISPLHSLIHSLKLIVPTVSDKEQAKIWDLIDESVGRCIRSPFKYIDEFVKHRSNSRSVLSPLIVALIEQLRFVDTSTLCQGVEKWLTLLIRDSCILGEDWVAVYGICEGNSQLTSFLSGLKVTDAESFEECQKVCQSMRLIFGDNDVFELIIQSPAKEIIMSQSSLVVTNLFQLYAIRFRILHSANDDNSNELVKCLLNIIPDALFLEILRERYFGGFKQAADPNVIGLYFDRIGERHNHTDTSFDAVKAWVSTITDMRILCKVIWLLDIGAVKQLLPAVDDAKLLEACILDLTERGISIAGIDIDVGRICHQVIASQNEGLLLALEKNLTNLRCGNISNIIASLVDVKSASSTTISKVVSILINASTTVDQSILPIIAQKISEGQYEFVHVVSALCKSCGETIQPDLVEVAVQFSLEQLSKFKDTSEQLLLNCISLISFVLKRRPAKDDELKILSEFLSNVTGNVSVAGETVELFGALLEQDPETVKMWLRKCILWVTKRFTEDENISSITKTFITAFCKYRILRFASLVEISLTLTSSRW